jgi:hypothetical protein
LTVRPSELDLMARLAVFTSESESQVAGFEKVQALPEPGGPTQPRPD